MEKKVLITGSGGFIGKNLHAHLKKRPDTEIFLYDKNSAIEIIKDNIEKIDFIFHLAGVNRPKENSAYYTGNKEFTEILCDIVKSSNKKIPILFTSSIQVKLENDYGRSKKAAEEALLKLNEKTGNPVFIYRLPNVFGKWCRPNYNSVVATFCYNISHDLPIQINNRAHILNLVYVDDVIDNFLKNMESPTIKSDFFEVKPVYQIDLQSLADTVYSFKKGRETLLMESVGNGLLRALYSTYISYLEPKNFSYPIPKYGDNRGVFAEVLKTKDAGQFSFFTAHPGITRGGHYHHTKTEKFLVVKGEARFDFRNIITNELYTLFTTSDNPEIVETVPGWAHDITNIGDEEMIVMLWANEIFDKQKPDTIAQPVQV